MTEFHYKGVKQGGEIVEGDVRAASRDEVVGQLYAMGLTPIAISQARKGLYGLLTLEIGGGRALGAAQVTAITRELSTLLSAGLPLDRALGLLRDLANRAATAEILDEVLKRLRGGASFADALELRSDVFPADYRAMIRAGETSGTLDSVLDTLSRTRERADALRSQVRSALVYPAILLVVAGLTVVVLLTLVLPQFEPLFTSADSEMPFLTRVFMALGAFIGAWWWALVAGAAVAVVGFREARRNPGFRLAVDRRLVALPMVGALLAAVDTVRFGRTLGMLMGGGVAAPQALDTARASLRNEALAEIAATTAVRVRAGQALSEALSASQGFPPLFLQLVRVGEETGQLEAMLARAVEILDAEARRSLEQLVSLLVPVITLLLGGFVALIVTAILSAMFKANELVF